MGATRMVALFRMTQPKIQIKLTTDQLQTLIPPGSEMELALSSGCIENYKDRITKRVVDKLVGKKDTAIQNAIAEAEKQVATKEWHRASATLTQATKDSIIREIRDSVSITIKAEIAEQVKECMSSTAIKEYVKSVVKSGIDRITNELVRDYAKQVIQDKLASLSKSSLV